MAAFLSVFIAFHALCVIGPTLRMIWDTQSLPECIFVAAAMTVMWALQLTTILGMHIEASRGRRSTPSLIDATPSPSLDDFFIP